MMADGVVEHVSTMEEFVHVYRFLKETRDVFYQVSLGIK